MPPRIFRDILVIDRSALAKNMYQLLFSAQSRYRVLFAEEYESLFKRSKRLRPDLMIVNSNSLGKLQNNNNEEMKFPAPAILIVSKDRVDLRELALGRKDVVLIEKPFYPYDLISVANRLIFAAVQKTKERAKRSEMLLKKAAGKARKSKTQRPRKHG
jgi:DNA-binding NtrC family response regulator